MTLVNPSAAVVPETTPGFGARVGVSVLSFFVWISFVLLYLGFWSGGYTALQSVIVIVVSVLLFAAVNGAAWASWGARFARAKFA